MLGKLFPFVFLRKPHAAARCLRETKKYVRPELVSSNMSHCLNQINIISIENFLACAMVVWEPYNAAFMINNGHCIDCYDSVCVSFYLDKLGTQRRIIICVYFYSFFFLDFT